MGQMTQPLRKPDFMPDEDQRLKLVAGRLKLSLTAISQRLSKGQKQVNSFQLLKHAIGLAKFAPGMLAVATSAITIFRFRPVLSLLAVGTAIYFSRGWLASAAPDPAVPE
jgi:hypothetical protein